MTSLDDLSENVKKLQEKLRETQSSMHRICRRANELKERVSQQKLSPQQQQHNNKTNAAATTTTTTSTAVDTSHHDQHLLIKQQKEQIEELNKLVSTLTEEKNFWQQKSSDNEEEKKQLATRVHSLEVHNSKLAHAVHTYQDAVQIISTKSAQKLKEETSALKQHVSQLNTQLANVEEENYNLHMNNMQLKSVVQSMINVMRDASTQRETELIESRSSSLDHEMYNLRSLLKISSDYGSLLE